MSLYQIRARDIIAPSRHTERRALPWCCMYSFAMSRDDSCFALRVESRGVRWRGSERMTSMRVFLNFQDWCWRCEMERNKGRIDDKKTRRGGSEWLSVLSYTVWLTYLTLWLASYSTYRSRSCLRFYLLLLEGLVIRVREGKEGGWLVQLLAWDASRGGCCGVTTSTFSRVAKILHTRKELNHRKLYLGSKSLRR